MNDTNIYSKDKLWQSNYVFERQADLIRGTDCNEKLMTKLLQNEVLCLDIVMELEKIKNEKEKTLYLYQILEDTGIHWYEDLTKALYECSQNKAFRILLEGFYKNNERYPLLKCGIKIDGDALLDANVNLQGSPSTLRKLFPSLSSENVEDLIGGDSELQNEYIDMVVASNNSVELVDHQIPSPEAFHIDRLISIKPKIDPKIFQQNLEDIFVFKGLHQNSLFQLADRNRTSTSIIQLQRKTLDSRFILLACEEDNKTAEENYQDDWEDKHWEALKKMSNNFIHLIQAKNLNCTCRKCTVFLLEDSTAPRQNLSKWIENLNDAEMNPIQEEDLIQKANSNKGIAKYCICGVPGIGRTCLLKSLARKTKEKYPEKTVIYFTFEQVSKFIKSAPSSNAVQVIIKNICKSGLVRKILSCVFESQEKTLVLFLDAFDSLSKDETRGVCKFLMEISKLQSTTLFVSSRSQWKQSLGDLLGVTVYEICPFTKKQQTSFFIQSFEKVYLQPGDTRTVQSLVKAIGSILGSNEKDIMGIPFHCFLLADVYAHPTNHDSTLEEQLRSPVVKETSVYSLIKLFVYKRFEMFETSLSIDQLQNIHIRLALQCFKFGYKIDDDFPTLLKLLHDYDILSVGLVILRPTTMSFIHPSVVDFFIAEYFVAIVKEPGNQNDQDDLKRSFIRICANENIFSIEGDTQEILYVHKDAVMPHISKEKMNKFWNPDFLNLLNAGLAGENIQSVSSLVTSIFLEAKTPLQFYNILKFFIIAGKTHIFRLMRKIVEVGWSTDERFKSFFKTPTNIDKHAQQEPITLLILYAANVSREMLEECMPLLVKCEREIKDIKLQRNGQWVTPLHLALRNGDCELFEYLYKHPYNCRVHDSLRWCAYNSMYDNKPQKRVRICQNLIATSIEEKDLQLELDKALLEENVHPVLIKFFIEKGADISKSFDNELTIVHLAAMRMSSDDFADICKYLLNKSPRYFKRKKGSWISPIHFILSYAKDLSVDTLQDILDKTSVDINDIDDSPYTPDYNLLQAAVAGNQSVKVLRELVETRKVNVSYQNSLGQTVYHVAVAALHLEAIEYFLEMKEFDLLQIRDKRKNTPLLCVQERVNKLKFTTYVQKENSYLRFIRKSFANSAGFISGAIRKVIKTGDKCAHLDLPLLIDVDFKACEAVSLEVCCDYFLCKIQIMKIVDLLVNQGLNIEETNDEENTFAHQVAQVVSCNQFSELICNYDITKFLSKKNINGRTPLHFLLHRQIHDMECDMIKELLKASRYDINTEDNYGNNLFLYALQQHQSLIVLKALVAYGVKCNQCNHYGEYPLHIAITSKKPNFGEKRSWSKDERVSIIKYLLSDRKADANQKDAFGSSPLILLMDCPGEEFDDQTFKEIINELLNHDANIDAVDILNFNVMFIAVARKRSDQIYYHLLMNGASPKIGHAFQEIRGATEHYVMNREFLSRHFLRGKFVQTSLLRKFCNLVRLNIP